MIGQSEHSVAKSVDERLSGSLLRRRYEAANPDGSVQACWRPLGRKLFMTHVFWRVIMKLEQGI